ncbi:MAG: hypothetical protein ACKOWQ_06925 [Aquirufa sp.]
MLNKIKSISWELVGLFCLKLFLYLLVIPITAYFVQPYLYKLAIPLILLAKQIPREDHYGLQIYVLICLAINTSFFYIYLVLNRFFKSILWQRFILILFIGFPAFIGVVQFTMSFYWSFLGSLIFNGYFYAMYFSLKHFLPSFRGQLK